MLTTSGNRSVNRWAPEELLSVGAKMSPAPETARCGDWTVRATPQWTRRGNSVLAMGEPDSIEEVIKFYRSRALIPRIQSLVDSTWTRRLLESGWRIEGPPIAVLAKDLVRRDGPDLSDRADETWLTMFGDSSPAARDALHLGTVGFHRIGTRAMAKVDLGGEWSEVSALWVAPAHRRHGVASRVLNECESWASRSADKMFLWTANPGIVRLFEGYRHHHSLVFLRPAGPRQQSSSPTRRI